MPTSRFCLRALAVVILAWGMTAAGSTSQVWYVEAYKVYMNLVWLSGVVGTGAGDVAGGADHRPTDGSVQVLAEIEKDLAGAKAGFDALILNEIPAYNKSAAGKVAPISVTPGS